MVPSTGERPDDAQASPGSEPTDATVSLDSESTDSEPTDSEPTDSELTDTDATDTDATDTQYTDTQYTDTQSTDIESTDIESTDSDATDSDATDTDATDIESTDSEPASGRQLTDAVEASDDQPIGRTDPELPDDIDPRDLDADVRSELRTLSAPLASAVAKRLVASGTLLDDDAEGALAHAMVARRLAPRVASVREAVGLAAYHAGEWQAAIGELRTYHRITGRQTHLAVIADCERALGRPERAVDLYRAANLDKLAPDEAVELLIVAAGARGDLGQLDAAAAMLQVPDLRDDNAPWAARLRYAYADTLRAAGRRDEAREWFARAADVDDDLVTDAAERLLDMDGVVIEDAPEDGDGDAKPAGYAVVFAAPEVENTDDATVEPKVEEEPREQPDAEEPPR